MGGHRLFLSYADTSSITPQPQPDQYNIDYYHNQLAQFQDNQAAQWNQRKPANFPQQPTDTMIVRNLDLVSTEESIRAAFGYITKKPIVDIRLAKDRMVSKYLKK